MFLSKRNGVYYLWYEDESGRRQKVSTRSKVKRDALAFVRAFQPRSSRPVKCHSLSLRRSTFNMQDPLFAPVLPNLPDAA
jgi:hypothetical protein